MLLPRERMLSRIRRALRTSAPRPAPPTDSPIGPPVPDLEERFRAEFAELRGELIEREDSLKSFLSGFQKIATDGSELVRQFVPSATAEVRAAELGVTGCDCLLAATGSIVVSTRSAGGRLPSVLPPVHLVIARREQLVRDLEAGLAFLRTRYGSHWPSALSIITGPSRTADIEKILVMGAHGPKRLALFLAE